MSQYFTEIGSRLVQKWERLLEGIDKPNQQITTAILLENESQKGGLLLEDTMSGQSSGGATWGQQVGNAAGTPGDYSAGNNIAPFQHYLLPLVRRVYPNLIANELVGVQPMTSPASLVFYLKYRYTGLVDQRANVSNLLSSPQVQGTGRISDVAVNKGQTAAGTEYGNFIGNTWNIDPYYSLQTNWREPVTETVATGGTGAAGAFTDYAVNASPMIANTTVVVRWVLTTGAGAVAIISNSVSPVSGSVLKIERDDSASITGLGGGTLTIDTTNGTVAAAALTFSGGFSASTAEATVTYDYNMEGNRQLPEIELQVESQPVTAQTRKLRTKWTIEASQDLRAMHNIDAEQELVALLANEVTAEIDREIINDLITNAAVRIDYNYSDPFLVGGSIGGSNPVNALPTGTTFAIAGATNFADRNKALFYQILEVSNQIYRQSLRGAGNWVVTSPEVASKLESLLEFKPEGRTDFTYSLGIVQSGSLNGQMKLFKDPLFPTNGILVGFKGNTFMDSGYFYCPYIPLQLTPTVLDPESFNPRKGLVTRYGKVLVENGSRMYGYIKVDGLTAVGASELPGFTQAQAGTVDRGQSTLSGDQSNFNAGVSDPGSELI